MRFKAVKDEIYSFIQYANSFTSPKNLNTVLQNILIDAESDGVTLRATDMQVGFSGKVEVSVEQTGTATVSGKKLLDIIKEIPDGSVIDFTFDGSKINIDSGKSSFKLSTISHEIFPTMAEISPEYYLKIKSELLYDLLKKDQLLYFNRRIKDRIHRFSYGCLRRQTRNLCSRFSKDSYKQY